LVVSAASRTSLAADFGLLATYPSAATPISAMPPRTQKKAFGRFDARVSLTELRGGTFLFLG